MNLDVVFCTKNKNLYIVIQINSELVKSVFILNSKNKKPFGIILASHYLYIY